MGQEGISNFGVHDPGLVSHGFTNIDKRKEDRKIMSNVVLRGEWGVAVICTRSRCDSREI